MAPTSNDYYRMFLYKNIQFCESAGSNRYFSKHKIGEDFQCKTMIPQKSRKK